MAAGSKGGKLKNPLNKLLGYQVRRASFNIMRDLNYVLVELDLSPALASVMIIIESNPGVKQIEIGQLLDIKRANMATIIAKLDERELIQRSAVDGRSYALTISTTGLDTVTRLHSLIAAHEKRLAGAINSSEKAQIIETLSSITESIQYAGSSKTQEV